MIDLTKPIRRKGGKKTVIIPDESFIVCHDELPICKTIRITRDELERDYENIPETRRPREWWIHLGAAPESIYESRVCVDCIHVIEWPEGAPLPDWPEDKP